MPKIKEIIKSLTPPIFIKAARYVLAPKKEMRQKSAEPEVKAGIFWSPDYPSWQVAKAHCSGYESKSVLEKCKTALLKIKNGEAVYERDGELFDEIKYSWGLLAGLQRAALENNGRLCVLDFGGSLGTTYYQNRDFLNTLKSLTWCIVEQPHFVNCGRENFESEQLRFYHTIEDCLKEQKPNVLLLSGVLPYLEDTDAWTQRFVDLQLPYLIFDRTPFVTGSKNIIKVQHNVSADGATSSYVHTFFNKEKLIGQLRNYKVIAQFGSHADINFVLNETEIASWEGLICKKQ